MGALHHVYHATTNDPYNPVNDVGFTTGAKHAQLAFDNVDGGGVVVIAKDHNEETGLPFTANRIYTILNSTWNNKVTVIVEDRLSGDYAPYESTPQIFSGTTGNYNVTLNFDGVVNGLVIETGGSFFVNTSSKDLTLNDVTLKQGETQLSTSIIGGTGLYGYTRLNNCRIYKGNYLGVGGGYIRLNGLIRVKDLTLLGYAYQSDTNFFLINGQSHIVIDGLDASSLNITASITSVFNSTVTYLLSYVELYNYKQPAMNPWPAFRSSAGYQVAMLYNSGQSGINDALVESRNGMTGDSISDSSVYRNDGWESYESKTRYSLKLSPVTTLNRFDPLITPYLNGVVLENGPATIKAFIAHNYTITSKDVQLFLLARNNDDIATTLTSSGPSVTNAPFDPTSTGSVLAVSTKTWTSAGGLTFNELSITIPNAKKGVIKGYIALRKYELGDFFVCPKLEIN